MILLCKTLYRAFVVFVQSSLQVVCHTGVQDSISFVGQKVDIILFHALTAFLEVEFAEAFLLSERVLRDCHVASLLAMTNRGCMPFLRWFVLNGSTYLRLPRRFAPRNDKSEVRTVLRWLVPNSSAFPRLHPKGTSSRFAPVAISGRHC